MGYDEQALYITADMLENTDPSFYYPKITILNMSEVDGGSINYKKDIIDFKASDQTVPEHLQPMRKFGTSTGYYLANTQTAGEVRIWSIQNPLNNPTLSVKTTITLGNYSQGSSASQEGSNNTIDAGDYRISDMVCYNGYVYGAYTAENTQSNGSMIVYFKLDSGNNFNLLINGKIETTNKYYYYPELQPDSNGNIAFVFNQSSTNDYAGVAWAILYSGSQNLGPIEWLKEGVASYYNPLQSRNRWGDYNGVSLDPLNNQYIWICGEWADNNNQWSTQIGEINTSNTLNITVDQKLDNGARVGYLKNWQGGYWGQQYSPPQTFPFQVDSIQTILGDQTIYSNQKYNNWSRNTILESDVRNYHSFTIQPNDFNFTSNFLPTYSGTTIQNFIDGVTANGNIYFQDPWFIDYPDSNFGNQKRNEGMSAPFISRHSPFSPDYSTSYGGNIYNGVISNQLISSGNYYSVRAPLTQPITVNGSNYTGVFQNWRTSNAQLQQVGSNPSGYDQKAVVFTGNPAAITANYKGIHLSSDANAFTNNSQRRLIETQSGGASWQHQVYTSNINDTSHVWIEHSSDGGATWILGNNGQPLDGSAGGKNPSIAFVSYSPNYNYIGVVWQQQSGSHYAICGKMFNQTISSSQVPQPVDESDYTLFTEPSDAYSVNANPNIVLTGTAFGPYFITFERKSTSGSLQPGINWIIGHITDVGTGLDGPFGTLESSGIVSGTDANTTNTQISVDPQYANYANTVAVNLIRQQGSPGLIYSHYIYLTESSSWSYSQYDDGAISYNSNVNSAPSVASLLNDYYAACWLESYQMVYFSLGYDVRYYYGNYATSCSINRGGSNSGSSGFAVWSQQPNFTGPYSNQSIRFDNGSPAGSSISTLSTAGKYVQTGNGAGSDLSNMYVSSFYPFTLPYYFSSSAALAPLAKGNPSIAEGRGFVIGSGDSSFAYSFGNLNVDGSYIGFVSVPDTSNFGDLNVLTNALVTEPFLINAGSKVSFSEKSGFADSAAAVKALGKNGFIHYKIQLVDNSTGDVLGSIKDESFTSSNAYSMKDALFTLSTAGLAGKTIKAEIIVETNLAGQSVLASSNYTPDENSIQFLQNNKIPAAIRNARRNVRHSNIILTKSLSDVNGVPASTQANAAQQLTLQGPGMPKTYALEQNYPNPFNPTTIISYQLPKDGLVTLKIYDILGNEVKTLTSGYKPAGQYSVSFDASKLASGVYFYQLSAGNFISTKKMMLLK